MGEVNVRRGSNRLMHTFTHNNIYFLIVWYLLSFYSGEPEIKTIKLHFTHRQYTGLKRYMDVYFF